MHDEPSRLLAFSGALLLTLGLFTGIPVAFAMTGGLTADPASMLAAHLAALMGAFWMFGLGWTMPLVRYGTVARTRIAWAVIASNYANWALTVTKSCLHVHGLEAGGSTSNTTIFALLNAFVVLPSLVASVAWVWGLRGREK